MTTSTILAGTPPSDDTDIRSDLQAAARLLGYAHRHLVAVVRRALSDQFWCIGGIRTPVQWLTCYAAVSPATARDVVIAQLAPASHERSIAEIGEHMTVTQMRRSLRQYGFADDARRIVDQAIIDSDVSDGGATGNECDSREGRDDGDDEDPVELSLRERRALLPARLSMSTTDGRFHLRFDAPAEHGAVLEQAIREAKDRLFHEGHVDATLADGLILTAHQSLEHAGACTPNGRDRFRVLVHVDAEGNAWTRSGAALAPTVRDKLACDAVLATVLERDGVSVSVGRTRRTVPLRTRRLVEDRDRGCRHPGCTATGHVDVHHIVHWADGGATDLDNLISLCPHHHDRHHAGDFSIRVTDSGDVEFCTPYGYRIGPDPSIRVQHQLRAATMLLNAPPEPYAKPSHDRLDTRWLNYGPPQNPPAFDDGDPDERGRDRDPTPG